MTHTQTHEETGFKSDAHRLGQSLGTLKTDVGTLAHGAVDTARSGMAEIRQGAHHAADVVKDKFEDAKDATESFRHVVGRHPLTSIGVAAGVGMLIGLVVFRPRS